MLGKHASVERNKLFIIWTLKFKLLDSYCSEHLQCSEGVMPTGATLHISKHFLEFSEKIRPDIPQNMRIYCAPFTFHSLHLTSKTQQMPTHLDAVRKL